MSKRYREKPFTIFSRKLASGKTIWYYQTYNEDGKRLNPVSTGIGFTRERDKVKSRKECEAYCFTLFKHDQLKTSTVPTLVEWVEMKAFWDWNQSSYVRGILARSGKARPGITESYCITARQITKDYVIPVHGDKQINEITPYDCERLLFDWIEGGCSNKSANNRKSVYSTILSDYEHDLKMRNPKADYFNPWKMVSPLSVDKNKYGALTINEVVKIITAEGVDLSSKRASIYFLASKIAFMAGLRIGEVCGLFTDDVKDIEMFDKDNNKIRLTYLEISKQWNPKTKSRTLVKDKDIRKIPISAELRNEMEPLLTGSGRFLFSFHPRQETNITANRLREWLYQHMNNVGVTEEIREGRNIAFHSARRFFNTLLRHERVADDVIRRFTGHDSVEMTDHYTDYLPEDLQAISQAQSKLLTGGIKGE